MVNTSNQNQKDRVEFVSYTGEWPNLCTGVLSLIIDDKLVHFGHDYVKDWRDDDNFDAFWVSGGSVSLHNDNCRVKTGEWTIYRDLLPEKYRDLANDIDKVFNENIPFGCCGGCV